MLRQPIACVNKLSSCPWGKNRVAKCPRPCWILQRISIKFNQLQITSIRPGLDRSTIRFAFAQIKVEVECASFKVLNEFTLRLPKQQQGRQRAPTSQFVNFKTNYTQRERERQGAWQGRRDPHSARVVDWKTKQRAVNKKMEKEKRK